MKKNTMETDVNESYKVLFTGVLKPGAEPSAVVEAFCQRFGVSEEKGHQLIGANREVLLKKNMDLSKAERYRDALEKVGLTVRLDPSPPSIDTSGLSLEPMETPESDEEDLDKTMVVTPEMMAGYRGDCPKCGSDNIKRGECLGCGIVISKYLAKQSEQQSSENAAAANPYAAPEADLNDEVEHGDRHAPISVPMGHGWQWLSTGFGLFKKNPWAWIGAMVVWMVISILLGMIPLVSLLLSLFSGVVMGGFMLGAQEQDDGGDFRVGHLFAGFSNHFGGLLLVGVLYLVGIIVIAAGIGITVGGSFMMMGAGMENPDPAAMEAMMMGPTVIMAILVGFLLFMPVLMAYWFAPALVALEGVSAISAMGMSFKACLKNVLPFLLYGIIALVLLIVGMIPVGLGLLVVGPMVTASIYAGYRDIFYS
ncbi:MAG: hypothetical protein GY934_03305 [Gammaproteobacteria bacterium]|nr:hypothetical protein [Gammaproteobacteria bacterium]